VWVGWGLHGVVFPRNPALTPAHPAPPPPRSYGTIKFATTAAADAAIEGHNGTDLEGRTLTVKLDRFA